MKRIRLTETLKERKGRIERLGCGKKIEGKKQVNFPAHDLTSTSWASVWKNSSSSIVS